MKKAIVQLDRHGPTSYSMGWIPGLLVTELNVTRSHRVVKSVLRNLIYVKIQNKTEDHTKVNLLVVHSEIITKGVQMLH